MKRVFAIVLAGLALWSCKLEDPVFSITNLGDFLNVNGETLVNDYGMSLPVAEDDTDGNWKKDGARIYAQFDVLNVQYDIKLRTYYDVLVQDPIAGTPSDSVERDPIESINCDIRQGWFNAIFEFYYYPESGLVHTINLYHQEHSDTLDLFFSHIGNGENPSKTDPEKLKRSTGICSFPVTGIVPAGQSRIVRLSVDALEKDDSGNYSVKTVTRSITGSPVVF